MNARRGKLRFLLIASSALFTPSAFAGMTVYFLNDIVRLRLEELSFFSVVLCLCGWGVKGLWNSLAKDFSSLPRLTYRKAMALTLLLSVLMLLVLSMISGARELMTPGAWNRQGSAYRLNTEANQEQRRISIESLRSAIFSYARQRDGKFPSHDYIAEIPERVWLAPDVEGTRYIYFGGFSTNDSKRIIACEPKKFGDPRYVLLGSGEIQRLNSAAIAGLMTSTP